MSTLRTGTIGSVCELRARTSRIWVARLEADVRVAVEHDFAGLLVDDGLAEVTAEQVLVGLVRPHRHGAAAARPVLTLTLALGSIEKISRSRPIWARTDGLALLEHDAIAARSLDVLRERGALELGVLLTTAGPRGHGHPLLGAAVFLADGDVLADVHEPAREVARVGRTQRRVGQTLAGAVGGDEELEHREALDEARLHRLLDDLALRVAHLTAPAGELADLLDVAAGAGGGHHVDRVERLEVGLRGRRDLHVGLAPDLLDLVAPLLFGEEAVVVLVLELLDHGLVRAEDLGLLLLGDDDVVLGDGDRGARGEVEADLFEHVEDAGHLVGAVEGHEPLMKFASPFLVIV